MSKIRYYGDPDKLQGKSRETGLGQIVDEKITDSTVVSISTNEEDR